MTHRSAELGGTGPSCSQRRREVPVLQAEQGGGRPALPPADLPGKGCRRPRAGGPACTARPSERTPLGAGAGRSWAQSTAGPLVGSAELEQAVPPHMGACDEETQAPRDQVTGPRPLRLEPEVSENTPLLSALGATVQPRWQMPGRSRCPLQTLGGGCSAPQQEAASGSVCPSPCRPPT